MLNLFAVVTVCGLYQAQYDTCLSQTDRKPSATRSECIARAQVMQKNVKSAFWYARIPEPHSVKIRCVSR